VAQPGTRTGEWVLTVPGERLVAHAVDERTSAIREMTGGEAEAREATVVAPMPGMVVRVEVEVGQTVTAGQGVVIVEAMKMENEPTSASPASTPSRAASSRRCTAAALDDAAVRRLRDGGGDERALPHLLLEQGQTGLSVAFDLPTQMGYDSDAAMAAGEVGRVGVAIDSIDDMRRCSTASRSTRSRPR
jgi:hypothetical protein